MWLSRGRSRFTLLIWERVTEMGHEGGGKTRESCTKENKGQEKTKKSEEKKMSNWEIKSKTLNRYSSTFATLTLR